MTKSNSKQKLADDGVRGLSWHTQISVQASDGSFPLVTNEEGKKQTNCYLLQQHWLSSIIPTLKHKIPSGIESLNECKMTMMCARHKKSEILHVTVDDGYGMAHGSQLVGSAVSGKQKQAAVVICSPILQTCTHNTHILVQSSYIHLLWNHVCRASQWGWLSKEPHA